MIAPKKKISKSKGASRTSTWMTIQMKKLTKRTNLVKCTNCGTHSLSHRVCPNCGYYGGKQVMTVKTKSRAETVEA